MKATSFPVFDVVIVGAGPAGCAAALGLAGSGLKVAVMDKARFPRDKICGDALSADVIKQLGLLPGSLLERFSDLEMKTGIQGVRFYAPSHEKLDIDFKNSPTEGMAPGYTVKRFDFDQFLFDALARQPGLEVLQGHQLGSAVREGDYLHLHTNKGVLKTRMAIGAGGAHSVLAKQLGGIRVEKDHYCAGLRAYYEGLTSFDEPRRIELHFYKDVLPGYFWVFPLANGQANVGIGMLSSSISKRNVDLKRVLMNIITQHPNVAPRFASAKMIDGIKGFGLPIGSKKRVISGERFLLTGDAAALIDPFTGEGIGNAIRSGRIAAAHVSRCFSEQRFDTDFNMAYDKEVYRRMWNELRLSRHLQQLLRYPKLFDLVVRKANRSSSLRVMLASAMEDVELKKELLKPSFYFRLFMK